MKKETKKEMDIVFLLDRSGSMGGMEDDTIGGYNYDLLRLMSDSTGCPMKFHPIVTLEKALAGLDNGRYDMVVAQFPMTAGDTARLPSPSPSTSTSRCWSSVATAMPSTRNWTLPATQCGW